MYSYADFVRESELNARLGWLVMLGGLAYLLRHTVLQKLLVLMLTLFVISGALDIMYAVTFGGVFTSASLEAFSGTDQSESIEFIFAYVGLENSLILAIYLVLAFIALRQVVIQAPINLWRKVAIFLGLVMVIVAYQQIQERNRAFDVIPGFAGKIIDYGRDSESLDAVIQMRVDNYNNSSFVVMKGVEEPHTLVVIIGESLNRNHMSLYGYSRATTPKLDALTEELIVFDNTVSAFAQTSPSLSTALTEVGAQNIAEANDAFSLLEVYKKAGYKTWWLSNQQPSRYPTTPMAALADETYFISHDFHGVESYRYDGYLTPKIEKAFADSSPYKLVFIHLMGSHLQYESRYPSEEFSVFNTTDGAKPYKPANELSRRQLNALNQYDNSVLYTDSLLGEWIEMLSQHEKDRAASMVFFADHGEEIFDSKNFKGHGPDGATRHMLEIPYIVWRNDHYRQLFYEQDKVMMEQKNQPFLLDDFFHFGICMSNLKTELYKPHKSICDDQFTPKPRVIYGKNYEEYLD